MSYPATFEQDQPRLTPAVQAIIAINVAVAFLQMVAFGGLSGMLAFDSNSFPTRWWSAATYLFAHVSVWHLLANMYGLYLFGPRLERVWGYRKFAWFYLLCGLGGVAVQMLFFHSGQLLGASAAVFGVMTAYAMQWPDEELYFLFAIPMRVRTLVAGLFAFDLALGVMGTGNAAGVTTGVAAGAAAGGTDLAYFAHVGGVLAAFAFMKLSAASPGMDQVRQRVANLPDADEPPRAIPRNMPRRERGDEVDDIVAKSKAIASKRVASLAPPARRREGKGTELDRVLDKISEQGIESLTLDERKVLEEMSRKLRDR